MKWQRRNSIHAIKYVVYLKYLKFIAEYKLTFFVFVCAQLTRPAQDLLMSLCMNCNSHGADDMEVISNLIKIRLKPKVLLNHYMLCVRSVDCLCVLPLTCFSGQWLKLTGALPLILQGAAQCTQRQPGHYGETGHLQWAVQCQES